MNRDEIALERKTTSEEPRDRGDKMWSGAWRVARIEVGQTWPSYLIAALATTLIGLLCMNSLWLGLESYGSNVEGIPATLVTDWLFLFVLANLGINWTSLRWMYVHRDPFTGWLSFLRTLPISPRDLVLGRLTVMLAATAVMSFAFFLPTYALFPALRAEIPPLQLFWFALFWIGYALFWGGFLLYLELGVKGRAVLAVCLVWAALIVSLIMLVQVSGIALVEGSLGLVRARGPLAAVLALAVGAGGLFLWCRLLEWRLRTRELAS